MSIPQKSEETSDKKLEDFSVQSESLTKQITATRRIALILLFTGVFVILSVPLLFREFPLHSCGPCDSCDQLNMLNFIINTIVIAAGIICFLITGSKLNTVAGYEKQLLKLNDLTTAIRLLGKLNGQGGEENGTADKDKTIKKYLPSERDKATQQVITTLLNSYTG